MCAWDQSGLRRCGAGSAVVGMRCGRATLGADEASDGMTCAWDRSKVRRCGAGSDVVGMRCGRATLGDDAGVCVTAARRGRAEGGVMYWGEGHPRRWCVWGW